MTPIPRHAALLALTLALALLPAFAGCSLPRGDDDADGLTLTVTTEPDPPVVGPIMLMLALRDGDEPLRGATVSVEGTMNHAGMAPVLRDASEQGAGEYHVPDFELTMPGDWIIIARGTLADGEPFEVRSEIDDVRIADPDTTPASEHTMPMPTPTEEGD